ncbi:vigilin [Nephila pilipes]|uniref:Vigilin n=1 Tax=Nephila pilipes TaxID=299642 RepID=A0A8X6Q4K4_NEPPI|nr:vigilin [Nephila pilipes]
MLINENGSNTLPGLPIEVTSNEVELIVQPYVPNTFKDKVQQLISNYVPHETKISVSLPDENSDLIKRTGSKEGIDKAHHEIQLISDEQSKLAFERLLIPKMYHPFIIGPFKETINQIIGETKGKINISPASVTRKGANFLPLLKKKKKKQ